MHPRRWLPLAALLATPACGKVVGDLPPDGSGGPADASLSVADAAPVGPTTIKAIRMTPPPDGTDVELRGVVVIARETSGGNGTLVVQDADGGDFSGMILFCNFGDGQCNLTRNEIDTMAIGQVLDVNATFDIVQPMGTPPPPAQPRLVRAQVNRAGISNPTPRVVAGNLVQPAQAGNTATRALLWTYIRVNGPVAISSVTPMQFMFPCPNTPDGGSPEVAHRAVLARVTAQTDLAVGVPRLDMNAMYCLFECGVTCQTQLMVGDTFEYVAGVLDTHNRDGAPQGILLVPSRGTDVGPKQ
jgi:hypothetical protein